jgi:hypothetical protein
MTSVHIALTNADVVGGQNMYIIKHVILFFPFVSVRVGIIMFVRFSLLRDGIIMSVRSSLSRGGFIMSY